METIPEEAPPCILTLASESDLVQYMPEGTWKPVRVHELRKLSPEECDNFRDIEAGRAIDEENEFIYQQNLEVVNYLNPLLVCMNQRPIKPQNPDQSYADLARRTYNTWCKDPGVRIKEAIHFLRKREKLLYPDFLDHIDDLPRQADEIAFRERCEEMRKIFENKGGIRVRSETGVGTWDGISEQDSMGRYVRWQQPPAHNFLSPKASVVVCTPPMMQ